MKDLRTQTQDIDALLGFMEEQVGRGRERRHEREEMREEVREKR